MEIFLLCSSKFIPFKKRDNLVAKFFNRSYAKSVEMFMMIVRASIYEHVAASEKIFYFFERAETFCALRYYEFRKHLPTIPRRLVAEDAY